jgi:hypothetical protein
MEIGMRRLRAVWVAAAWTCLVLAGCPSGRQAGSGGGLSGREKGMRDAERDVQNGILKLKEYPPLPYSLAQIKYIRLLQERCGVGHEVVDRPGNDPELRAEVEAYNGVMNAAIRQKFGPDILAKLREEAGGP